MGSESGEVVAGTLGQSQEKWWQVHGDRIWKSGGKYEWRQSLEMWWQVHGVTVRVWKSGGKHLASQSEKVVANIHGIIV
jgi:hypothetical protein